MFRKAPTHKAEFYERYLKGEFGNKPRTWNSYADLVRSTYRGNVTLRNMELGGTCIYGLSAADLVLGVWPKGFANLDGCRFNESMPDEHLTIQGNVMPDTCPGGIRLEYDLTPGIGHRDAMKNLRAEHSVEGLVALGLLKRTFWPSSYDDLMDLLANYPDAAAVEFSTYSKAVGELPNRNVVFWEVRNY